MSLSTLLRLQVIYFILGILYNGVSLFLMSQGQPGLAPTQPVMGTISMIIYALFLIPGYLRKITLYRILMGVAIIVIGYGGVVTHIINIFTQPQLYSSIISWALAVGINLFGLVLNIIAVSGKFKRN
jgi:multisubunit Na+/H+ antiporter MnhB subunit